VSDADVNCHLPGRNLKVSSPTVMRRTAQLLRSLLSILLITAGEGIQFLWLAVSSRAELSAEVLFLRKQLASYREHQFPPRRLTDAARYYDGKKVGEGRVERTVPMGFLDETTDVGRDTATPVSSATFEQPGQSHRYSVSSSSRPSTPSAVTDRF
jgi:hypothetical protein